MKIDADQAKDEKVSWNTFTPEERQAFNNIGIKSASVAHELWCLDFQPFSDYALKQNAWNFLATNFGMAFDVNDGKISVEQIKQKFDELSREKTKLMFAKFCGRKK